MSLARQTLLAVCSAVAVIALGSPCWIGAPGNGSPAFEKTFEMPSDTVQAELVISAPGFYEAYLDGVKIGDRVLDPSPTDFSKRVLSVRLPMDVKPGMRTLRILLGHGWYDQRAVSAWNNHEDRWRAEPCVRAEIVLWRKSGESVRIGTDRTWRRYDCPGVGMGAGCAVRHVPFASDVAGAAGVRSGILCGKAGGEQVAGHAHADKGRDAFDDMAGDSMRRKWNHILLF